MIWWLYICGGLGFVAAFHEEKDGAIVLLLEFVFWPAWLVFLLISALKKYGG